MRHFRPASRQRPCTSHHVYSILWEAGFPIICSKSPSLKLLLPPESPPHYGKPLILRYGDCFSHLTSQWLYPRLDEFETSRAEFCFHYFTCLWLFCLAFPNSLLGMDFLSLVPGSSTGTHPDANIVCGGNAISIAIVCSAPSIQKCPRDK